MSKKHTLWVIGDSTLSSFEDKYYYPRYGYGTMLDKYLDSDIEVNNIALSGRSSKSYTMEPEYKTLLEGMKEGDYLLIGFGHNDEKTEVARYTDANGDYKQEGTFAASLYNNYIKKANEAKTRVILCTPIVRRTPDGVWKNQLLHITEKAGEFAGGDYAEAVRKLGEDLNIPVVDMTEITKKFYDEIGHLETVNLHAWPSNKSVSVDNTHTNIWGARVNAFFVLREVKKLKVEELSRHITINEGDVVPEKEMYLISNPEYIPTVFNSELKDSTLWPEIDGWKGTVFGDIGDVANLEELKNKFVLEPQAADDSSDELSYESEVKSGKTPIHMAVKNNTGKIAAVSDGIAMYYKKIDVKKNFIFTAKLRINNYFSNDQVSFGLMVRDDVYIDKPTADILGDYVAAAPLLLTHEDKAWNCFARKSGILVNGGLCTKAYKSGDTINLRIESTSDGYACTFADEQTITGGFDFKLTSIDPEHVYAGMFVSRNADVTFTDYELVEKIND